MYRRELRTKLAEEGVYESPSDEGDSHLRLGVSWLGMLYLMEGIGFIRLKQDPPALLDRGTQEWEQDWENTYARPAAGDSFCYAEYGPIRTPNDALGYDLADAVRAWLSKPENHEYQGLSLCEAALVHPQLRKAARHVGPARVFWSHVQREPLRVLGDNSVLGWSILRQIKGCPCC